MEYSEFLETKVKRHVKSGIEVNRDEISPVLFEYQKDIVQRALSVGKFGVFADTGLGKTLILLECNRILHKHFKGIYLILSPLGVVQQTVDEAAGMLNLDVNICEVKDDLKDGLNITNYDKIHHFDGNVNGVTLDESSILKSFPGKIKGRLLDMFQNVKYKLCCTATPSPNDIMELLNHAEFLNVMKSNLALAIWFIKDSNQMGSYRIKKHAAKDFWDWVSSWACAIQLPSDYGYSDESHILPELIVQDIVLQDEIKTLSDLRGYTKLSATNLHKEKRKTVQERAKKIADLVNDSSEQFVIWCERNDEADAVYKLIPDSRNIQGSDSSTKKIQGIEDFTSGKLRVLVTKTKIFGFGLNLQNCHNTICNGLSYSYESYYQLVRRFWRFGQKHNVNVYRVFSEKEKQISRALELKSVDHNIMKSSLTKHIGLHKAETSMEYENKVQQTDKYTIYNGDCVQETSEIKSNSVDFSIFSPPFSQIYIYSNSYRDMGNSNNSGEFFQHYKFLLKDLYRVMKGGRIVAVHTKNLPKYQNSHGVTAIEPFRGMIERSMLESGFELHSETTIWKCPVREMTATKAQRLLHAQVVKDSLKSGFGLAEYLTLYKKHTPETENYEPVKSDKIYNGEIYNPHNNTSLKYTEQKPYKFDKYYGSDLPQMTTDEYYNSILIWQKYASPVWMDIRQTNVLNQDKALIKNDEKHICPLQLDIIARCLELYTNEDDLVFSPFAGIGSEGYQSLLMNRRFLGIELKEEYYNQMNRNLKRAVNISQNKGMF